MTKYPSLLIDFETVDYTAEAVVIDLAAVAFFEHDIDDFETLVNSRDKTFFAKFDVKLQSKRKVNRHTLDWWHSQPDEVKAALAATKDDLSIPEAMKCFKEFCDKNYIGRNSLIYSRGTSFDMPILDNILLEVNHFGFEPGNYPVPFWNQRDVRTAIAYAMGDPHLRKLPIRKGRLNGFVKHNSIHDVCKDVILLQTCLAYSTGVLEFPDLDSDDVEWI